ncbi:high-potential iron-sulfur protein [Oceanisphaera sp. KMM 10153]|uniref:high-potential iron-sulfur protein n=1 Tax=Oceanisphaera submarina TaxID=3390193 RepID=UPI003975E433
MKQENDNRLTHRNRSLDTGGMAETDPLSCRTLSRRTVLRSALAIGFGVLIPFTLIGCERKEESGYGAAPAAANPEAGGSTKVSQASVHYQSQPNDSGQKCSQCQHFISESNSCQLVEGTISSEGWCDLWTKQG